MRRLPAEWEPQSGIILTWPHASTDWADQLESVERLYSKVAATISCHEPVLIVCQKAEQVTGVRERAIREGAVGARLRLAVATSDDTWTRDHGPIGVLRAPARPILIGFRFNGWGGKFRSDQDDQISARLSAAGAFGACGLEPSRLVLEGGAIETDGRGTLLAVTRTLVDPARNPGWSRRAIEQELCARLGLTHFLWLEHGALSGDDTDGHIDTLARFCAPDTLCYVRCEDPSDADYAELHAMEQELRALRDPHGRPYRLVPLPCPAPLFDPNGRRLPAGYANFLIIDGAVLLPVYGDPADSQARAILGRLFPDRQILPLDCRPLIRQGGSLHCISMQVPAGIDLESPAWPTAG